MKTLLVSCALLCLYGGVLIESTSAVNQPAQDYEQISDEQQTRLVEAVKKDDAEGVEYMINQWHADPNLKDERGATLIMIAFEHASLRTVPLLRELGAIDEDGCKPIKDNAGNTIAYYAVQGGFDAFMFGLHNPSGLGYFGMGICFCADGRMPEDVALELGEQDIVDYLDIADYVDWENRQDEQHTVNHQSIADYIEWRKMQGKQHTVNYQSIAAILTGRECELDRIQ